MKFPESLGAFSIYLFLPALTGGLSGFIVIHLLFNLVRILEKWRGRRVALVLTALIFAFPTFLLLISPILMESLISGLIFGLFALLASGTFALSILNKSKWIAGLTGSLLGFSIGSFSNLLIGFFVFRPELGAENYLLLVPFAMFILIGGLAGLISSGADLLVRLR